MFIKKVRKITAVFLLLMVTWCGLYVDPAFAEYNKPYYIEVDLTNQIVTIYNTEDGSIARQMLCSAGMNDATPTGTWYMVKKEKPDERQKWYYFKSFHCYAQYASRIFYQYFFHSITFNKRSDDAMSATAAAAFGNPASHGCIRLRIEDAKFIAENCLVGTKVTIFKSGVKDEELRKLLYVSSYIEDDMPYSEFLGISEDALGRGSTGEKVGELQSRLHELGYYDGEIDSSYNADTIAAVKQLQKDIGMAQNGIVSAELSDVVFSDDAPVSDGLITVQEGQTGPVVKKLQQALSKLKIYTGDLDGIYDLDVCVAVDLFQTMCGYTVDGTTASAEVQQAIYYEIAEITEALGEDFSVSKQSETVEMAKVTTPDGVRINVRSKPDTESDSLGLVKDGESVMLNATNDKWAQISCDAGTGYIYKKYLEPYQTTNDVLVFSSADGKTYTLGRTVAQYVAGEDSEAEKIASTLAAEQFSSVSGDVDYCTVNTGSDSVELNLRAEASKDSDVLAAIANGTDLRVLATGDGWTKVGYNDDIGYLMNDYLTFWTGTSEDVSDTAETMDSIEGGITVEGGNGDGEVVIDDVSDENITAIVVPDQKDGRVPVYAEADDSSEEITRLKHDVEVSVIGVDEETGWCLISYEGSKGYMKDLNLSFRLGDGLQT